MPPIMLFVGSHMCKSMSKYGPRSKRICLLGLVFLKVPVWGVTGNSEGTRSMKGTPYLAPPRMARQNGDAASAMSRNSVGPIRRAVLWIVSKSSLLS